ncbi:ADP-ribosylation factor-related protein 1 [Hordeum vulgare]|nr:ADP-ribosylation factor-related protein 1 [Hordeum vulgare]
MPLPWIDIHLPNNSHLSRDRVPIPPVPMSDRARRDEIQRRRRLPDDLYYDPRYTVDSPLWDTWFRDEHDVQRTSYFADEHNGPRRAHAERRARPPSPPQVRGRTWVRGLTPTPSSSPSPSPPPPPRMTEEEEARLVQRVMEDSMNTYDEREWVGPEEMMTLSADGDMAIPAKQPVTVKEVHEEQPVDAFPLNLVAERSPWSCTTTEMAEGVRAEPWCPKPLRSSERESSPRGEVVQALPAPPTFQGPSAHLWMMPPYINLTGDDEDNDDA